MVFSPLYPFWGYYHWQTAFLQILALPHTTFFTWRLHFLNLTFKSNENYTWNILKINLFITYHLIQSILFRTCFKEIKLSSEPWTVLVLLLLIIGNIFTNFTGTVIVKFYRDCHCKILSYHFIKSLPDFLFILQTLIDLYYPNIEIKV